MRSQPTHDRLGHRFVDGSVLLKAHAPADPGVVRLVPDAPHPLPNRRRSPVLECAPDDIAAAIGERTNGSPVVECPWKLGEGDHRNRANVEDGLHVGRERLPVGHGIGRALLIQEDPDDPDIHLAQACPDPLPSRTDREVPPTVSLVDAVEERQARFSHDRFVRLGLLVTTATPKPRKLTVPSNGDSTMPAPSPSTVSNLEQSDNPARPDRSKVAGRSLTYAISALRWGSSPRASTISNGGPQRSLDG